VNEATKRLFTLTQMKNEHQLPEICVVTSGKGGVGKSSISLNVAIILAQMKKKVLLIDADIHLGNLNLLLGVRPGLTIADSINDGVPLSDIIVHGPHGLDILPASSADLEMLESEERVFQKLSEAFTDLEHEYDMVIVDTAAGLAENVMSFVLGADKVAIIVTPDPSSIADAYGMMKVICSRASEMPMMMVANMVSSMEEGESLYNKMKLMVQRFLKSKLYYGGSIEYDAQIKGAVRQQRTLVLDHPRSKPVTSLKVVTRNLMKLPSFADADDTGLFERIHQKKSVAVGDWK